MSESRLPATGAMLPTTFSKVLSPILSVRITNRCEGTVEPSANWYVCLSRKSASVIVSVRNERQHNVGRNANIGRSTIHDEFERQLTIDCYWDLERSAVADHGYSTLTHPTDWRHGDRRFMCSRNCCVGSSQFFYTIHLYIVNIA